MERPRKASREARRGDLDGFGFGGSAPASAMASVSGSPPLSGT